MDGYALEVDVFAARSCDGEATETAEAKPLWTPLDRIPYDEMWEDDRLWVPELLAGRSFDGRYIFEDDTMLDHLLDIGPRLPGID